jgi:hypothetical protein
MATETPNHPAPDEIPDNERIGDEPNPSGKSGKSMRALSPSASRRLITVTRESAERLYRLSGLTPIKLGPRGTGGRRMFLPAVDRRPGAGIATLT